MRFLCILVALAVFIAKAEDFIGVRPRIMDPINAPVGQFPYAAKLKFTLANTPPGAIGIGSGVLITPNLVLTAGHCASDPKSGSGLTSMTATINGVDYNVSNYYVNPTYNGQSDTEGVIDAAILVLDIPSPVSPMVIYRGAIPVGTKLTLVGFGQIGSGTIGQIAGSGPPLGTVNYGFTTVESVGTNYMHWTYRLGEQTTAHGDSGGPSLVTIPQMFGDTLKLGGLCESGQDPTLYGQRTNELVVSSFMAWIDSIAKFTNIAPGPSDTRPAVAYRGQSFSITPSLVNNSFNNAPQFTTRFRLSKDGIYNGSNPFLVDAVLPTGIAAGLTTSPTYEFSFPYVTQGAYHIDYWIDPFGQLFESDTTDNFFSEAAPLVVLDESAPLSKQKFMVNLKSDFKDTLDVTFSLPSDLQFSSSSELAVATNGKTVNVYVGGDYIDSLYLYKGHGSGSGKITWNYRKGELHYTLSRASLFSSLSPYGVTNSFVAKTVVIPIWFEYDGIYYGTAASFFYIGNQNKNGKGS